MDKIRIDVEDFNELITLSCVESYVMACLKKMGFPVSLLYGESYLSIDEILYKFFVEQIDYAYFDGIPRLQDVAKKYGIIELEGIPECKLDEIPFRDWHVLVSIKPEAFMDMYGSQAWREDHFIYLDKEKENFFYVNDNPRDARIMTKNEVSEKLCSQMIFFRIKGQLSEENRLNLIQSCMEQVQQKKQDRLSRDELNLGDIIRFRDFLGVLRVSRKRLGAFLSNFEDCNELEEYLLELDKLYMRIEYKRMRKRTVDREEFLSILNDLSGKDIQATKKIRTILTKYHDKEMEIWKGKRN